MNDMACEEGLEEREEYYMMVSKTFKREDEAYEHTVKIWNVDGFKLERALVGTSEIKLTILRDDTNEADRNNLDYVGKVTLLENKVQLQPLKDSNISGPCPLIHPSSSDPEIGGPTDAGFDVKNAVQMCSLEEYNQLKSEKTNLEAELARCNEMIDDTKVRFGEMEKTWKSLHPSWLPVRILTAWLRQLKCMVESYKSLESRKIELENEIEVLQSKIDTLTTELIDERQS